MSCGAVPLPCACDANSLSYWMDLPFPSHVMAKHPASESGARSPLYIMVIAERARPTRGHNEAKLTLQFSVICSLYVSEVDSQLPSTKRATEVYLVGDRRNRQVLYHNLHNDCTASRVFSLVSLTKPAIDLNSGILASPMTSYNQLSLVVTLAPA